MKLKIIGHTKNLDFKVPEYSSWSEFTRYFIKVGYKIVLNDNPNKDFDALITFSHSSKLLRIARKNGVPLSKRVLVCWEPKVTNPKLFSSKTRASYGHVFAPSIEWASEIKGNYFFWPQEKFQEKIEGYKKWITREPKIVAVTSNKFSAVKGENYSFRRLVYSKLSKVYKDKFNLYGTNWNSGFFYDFIVFCKSLFRVHSQAFSFSGLLALGMYQKNYVAESYNKIETLNRHRISLVIENSSDYVSEKIFDAIRGQNIVIYVGANLELHGLNKNMVINTEKNVESIVAKLNMILEMSDKEQYLIMKQQFNTAKLFTKERATAIVLRKLAMDIHMKINK